MEKKKDAKKPVNKAKKTTKVAAKKTITKSTKKKKGFTLIELLAVIIILGILMIIAIPSVTKYINDSRKSAYVDTAKEIVSGTRNLVNTGKLGMYGTDTTYYIPAKYVNTENSLKSPYGEFLDKSAYIGVIYDGKGYKYYWISSDDTGQGIDEVTPVDKLDTDKIKSDLDPNDIYDTVKTTGIGDRSNIKVLNLNGIWEDYSASHSVNEEGGESSSSICKKATVLHKALCNNGSCSTISGIGNGATITYGSLWDGTSNLTAGNALDCDVTGTGIYERFYYVTSSGNGSEKKAVLIYYANISNDGTTITKPSHNNYAYASIADVAELGHDLSYSSNLYGPATAAKILPSKSQWSNSQIIEPGTRQLKNENGGTTAYNEYNILQTFTYANKAARLLTTQELISGCPSISSVGSYTTGELDGCNYLLENNGYYEGTSGTNGYWLESTYAASTSLVWNVSGGPRLVGNYASNNASNVGVRPVIEVLESNISNE